MHSGLTLAHDALQRALDARLDARLERGSPRPIALGLSGGGDSHALLHLAADWARRASRPLLALTVDHGLSPQSAAWTRSAAAMAAQAGAVWRALHWEGCKPDTGLPAAAREARHALLAEAARGAGARVLLLAHTADDVAETEWMRARDAPSIGRLREWAPSPAWPEGRGMMLLRPLLQTSGGELRAWLAARGLNWIDDPANADLRLARPRARAARPSPPPAAPLLGPAGFGEALSDGRVRLPREHAAEPNAGGVLRAALACASGGGFPVHGRRLAALQMRLQGGGPVKATLGGAWVKALGDEVEVGREPGRRPPTELELVPGLPAVWDGRFEVLAADAGWRVAAAAGRMARLSAPDRAKLSRSPPAQRSLLPVFVRGEAVRFDGPGLRSRAIVTERFDLAVGRATGERDLP